MGILCSDDLAIPGLSWCEALLCALLAEGEVALALSNHRLTAEVRGHGHLIIHEQWLTIEMDNYVGRFHVGRNNLSRYEVVDEYGRQRAVHFFDLDGQRVFTCTLLGTAEGRADFEPDRLMQFVRLVQQYRSPNMS